MFPQNKFDWQINEIKNVNEQMINMFEQVRQVNNADPELLYSLAVLYFIARRYEVSVDLFREALKYQPDNYALWNKLGATLAHLGKPDEAMEAYH